MSIETFLLGLVEGFMIFAIGYIVGAYRERQYLKRQVADNRWAWLK